LDSHAGEPPKWPVLIVEAANEPSVVEAPEVLARALPFPGCERASSGRRPRGERVVRIVPRNHGLIVTLLATVSGNGITVVMSMIGATNRQV
jgi:hypothetical protein